MYASLKKLLRFFVLETASLVFSIFVFMVLAKLFGYFLFNEPFFPAPGEKDLGEGIKGCAGAVIVSLLAFPFAFWVHSYILTNFILDTQND